MRYIDEEPFLERMKNEKGIVLFDEGRSLCYETDDFHGFDFTNLTNPHKGDESVVERVFADERGIERAMIETLLNLMGELDQFPVRLIPVDDDWADDELESLIAKNYVTPEEGAVLTKVVEDGKALSAVEIDADEIVAGVCLTLPQLTLRSTVCAVIGGDGATLALVSRDEEVSFNTTDRALYEKARALMKARAASLPFEVVWVDDIVA
jgi:hypothetical protein